MVYDRIYNFSAGPSMLPVEVLESARDNMLNYEGSGMSVMEMSHRSKANDDIIVKAESQMRKVMNIPDNYKVIFMQGGATLQFAMVPLNLMNKNHKADYIVTGNFSGKAAKEAEKYGKVNIAWTGKDIGFSRIPRQEELKLDPEADYVHICFNNTIYGSCWDYIPDTGNVPLVADMSSCIMSEPIDVSKFALIYAGAQKNLAPAGVTLAIVRVDALGHVDRPIPTMLNYKTHIDKDSMYNTPPVLPIYSALQTLKWYKAQGGVAAMEKKDIENAAILYDEIDRNKLFRGTVEPGSRSIMNICFVMNDEYKDLEKPFFEYATSKGMVGIKGHRSVGGFRASCYNALPLECVEALVKCMQEFEAQH